MSERQNFDDAFGKERYGPGAGIPTSLGGTLGQISARQQKDLAEGRVQGGGLGMLILEMISGGLISRGILVLIVGFALGVGGANATPGSWFVLSGMIGGQLLMLLGTGMVVLGTFRRILRAFR
jgi:hypothetical protein